MRRSATGKTIYLDVVVWFDEETRHIHITAKNGDGFRTTVFADPKSKRSHPNLYAKLARCLKYLDINFPTPSRVWESADLHLQTSSG